MNLMKPFLPNDDLGILLWSFEAHGTDLWIGDPTSGIYQITKNESRRRYSIGDDLGEHDEMALTVDIGRNIAYAMLGNGAERQVWQFELDSENRTLIYDDVPSGFKELLFDEETNTLYILESSSRGARIHTYDPETDELSLFHSDHPEDGQHEEGDLIAFRAQTMILDRENNRMILGSQWFDNLLSLDFTSGKKSNLTDALFPGNRWGAFDMSRDDDGTLWIVNPLNFSITEMKLLAVDLEAEETRLVLETETKPDASRDVIFLQVSSSGPYLFAAQYDERRTDAGISIYQIDPISGRRVISYDMR